MIVSFPGSGLFHEYPLSTKMAKSGTCIHLVVEHFGLARLRLGDQRIVQDFEDILADPLQLILNLLAIFADDGNMLFRALGLFSLSDGRNDAPGRATGSDHIFVGHRKKVALIN